jgi:hypothetical protein
MEPLALDSSKPFSSKDKRVCFAADERDVTEF